MNDPPERKCESVELFRRPYKAGSTFIESCFDRLRECWNESAEIEKSSAADIEIGGCLVCNEVFLGHDHFLLNVTAYIL